MSEDDPEVAVLDALAAGVRTLNHDARVRIAHWLVTFVDDQSPRDRDIACEVAAKIVRGDRDAIAASARLTKGGAR